MSSTSSSVPPPAPDASKMVSPAAATASKSLDLPTAQQMVQASLRHAASSKLSVAVAVVDRSGSLLAFSKNPQAMPAAAHIAIEKAKTAVAFARDTMALETASNVKDGAARTALVSSGYLLMGGGVFLGRTVGAIGVSGGKPTEDHDIAKAGAGVLHQAQGATGAAAKAKL